MTRSWQTLQAICCPDLKRAKVSNCSPVSLGYSCESVSRHLANYFSYLHLFTILQKKNYGRPWIRDCSDNWKTEGNLREKNCMWKLEQFFLDKIFATNFVRRTKKGRELFHSFIIAFLHRSRREAFLRDSILIGGFWPTCFRLTRPEKIFETLNSISWAQSTRDWTIHLFR